MSTRALCKAWDKKLKVEVVVMKKIIFNKFLDFSMV
jgi:hypothetical protein